MTEEHSSPIKNWKQLLAVVVLAFLVPIIVIIFITQLVTGQRQEPSGDDDTAVLNRIKPVGEVVIAQGAPATGQRSGEQVFGETCKNCHEAGLAGAPKFGDKAAWARVLGEGEKTALDHALHGFKGMPAKGGNPDLTDDEVHRAVVYMANNAGANWKAPAPTAPGVATASVGAAAAATPAASGAVAAAAPAPGGSGTPAAGTAPAPGAASAAAKPDGKKVFEGTCMVCHGTGVAGAPKLGDKAAWAPRIKQGIDALYKSALTGKNAMPPKGGNTSLSDPDVKAAVDYMVAAAK